MSANCNLYVEKFTFNIQQTTLSDDKVAVCHHIFYKKYVNAHRQTNTIRVTLVGDRLGYMVDFTRCSTLCFPCLFFLPPALAILPLSTLLS